MITFWCVGYEGAEEVTAISILTDTSQQAAETMAETMFVESEGQWPGGRLRITDRSTETDKYYEISVTIGEVDEEGEADIHLDVQEVEA